ncbi:MAG: DUF4280 domain-containing protein [Paludibacteraceae bacterium]|nr:DUF4280 domain-containing protein [Paludibacteraceae bacterium]
MSGSHVVLDGALFVCNQGSVPNSIMASSNQKLYVQNKRVVTTGDSQFQTPAMTFGTCLLSTKKQAGQPCEYQQGEWDENTCYGDGIVLDSSKMYCSACAPKGGEITCLFHGQVCQVTAKDVADFDVETAVLLNTLAPMSGLDELSTTQTKAKNVEFGVSSIDLWCVDKKSISENVAPKAVPDLKKVEGYVRLGDKLIMEAKTKSKVDLSTAPVSWIVFQKEMVPTDKKDRKGKPIYQTRITDLKIYAKVGTPFRLKMKKPGKYFIEAVGNSKNFASLNLYYKAQESLNANEGILRNERLPLDAKCCKEVQVTRNDIVALNLTEKTESRESKSGNNVAVVRYKDSLDIKVVTLFDLAEDECFMVHLNKTMISYMLRDSAKSNYFSYDSDKELFTLNPLNVGRHRLRFELVVQNKYTFSQRKTLGVKGLDICCVNDFLNVDVTGDGEVSPLMVRPGSSFMFKVSRTVPIAPGNPGVLWLWEDGRYSRGDVLMLVAHEKEYDLSVSALLDESDALINAKTMKDSVLWIYQCQVRKNKIQSLSLDADDVYRGLSYALAIQSLYPNYDSFRDGQILGTLDEDPYEWTPLRNLLRFDSAGKHTISLAMGDTEPVTFEIEVQDATILEWGFFDSERRPISQVGFDTKFLLRIRIPAFRHLSEQERNELRAELWNHRTKEKLESSALDEAVFDEKGTLEVELLGADLTESREDLVLSPALRKLPCYVAGMNDFRKSGHFEKDHTSYLKISTSRYINGYFAGVSGNPQKSILKYGSEAKIVLYLQNVTKKERQQMILSLIENNAPGNAADSLVWYTKEFPEPNEDGRLEFPISEDIICESDHNSDAPRTPRLFYFEVVMENADKEEPSLLYAFPGVKLGDDYLTVLDEEGIKHLRCDYFWQLKFVKDGVGELNDILSTQAQTIIGEELKKGEGPALRDGECPRCNEEAELMLQKVLSVERFNKDAETIKRLTTICETYTRYMECMHMNTCWIKAHYFAQISVESGSSLKSVPEGMNYSREGLEDVFKFRLFETELVTVQVNGKTSQKKILKLDANGNRIYRSGVKAKLDKIFEKKGLEKERAIANYVYLGVNGNSSDEKVADGWRYRGGGMVQLTGKSIYKETETAIKAFTGKSMPLTGAEQICKDVELATVASMAYLARRNIQLRKYCEDSLGKSGMHYVANGQKNEFFVNRLVGSEHAKDKKTNKTNYDKKQDAFDEFYKVFETSKCEWSEEFTEKEDDVNIYRIDLDKFSVYKYQANQNSDVYIYKIYNHGKKYVEDYRFTMTTLKKRDNLRAFQFPETGPNWGRYGTPDEGGDNFISELNCACLLGLLYSLPLNGITDKIFYNDITLFSTDKVHKGHSKGNDIDLRYPNGTNKPVQYWKDVIDKCYGGNKEAFISHLEHFVSIAIKWHFTANFAQENITGAKECGGHNHHIHLGNTYYLAYKYTIRTK